MSNFARIFCAILFVSAANASLYNQTFHVKQRAAKTYVEGIRIILTSTQALLLNNTADLLYQLEELSAEVEEKMRSVTEDVDGLLKNNSNIDNVNECKRHLNELKTSKGAAIANTKTCYDTVLGEDLQLATKVNNAVNELLQKLPNITNSIDHCGDQLGSWKAIFTAKICLAKIVLDVDVASKQIVIDVMKLKSSKKTRKVRLFVCQTVKAKTDFLANVFTTITKTKLCITQKINNLLMEHS